MKAKPRNVQKVKLFERDKCCEKFYKCVKNFEEKNGMEK